MVLLAFPIIAIIGSIIVSYTVASKSGAHILWLWSVLIALCLSVYLYLKSNPGSAANGDFGGALLFGFVLLPATIVSFIAGLIGWITNSSNKN